MIISVDTTIMNELASISKSICQEMSEVCSCLIPISSHDDWNCSERDDINEAILANKRIAEELMTLTENFASTINKAADSFNEYETKNPQALLDMQSVISDSLAIYTPTVEKKEISLLLLKPDLSALKDKTVHIEPWIYHLKEWDNPIKVINYND